MKSGLCGSISPHPPVTSPYRAGRQSALSRTAARGSCPVDVGQADLSQRGRRPPDHGVEQHLARREGGVGRLPAEPGSPGDVLDVAVQALPGMAVSLLVPPSQSSGDACTASTVSLPAHALSFMAAGPQVPRGGVTACGCWLTGRA
jgi:hypothetical protein